MRTYLISFILVLFVLTACENVPDAFKIGKENYLKKNYELAADSLIKVKKTDEKYYDSSRYYIKLIIADLIDSNKPTLLSQVGNIVKKDKNFFNFFVEEVNKKLISDLNKSNFIKLLLIADTLQLDLIPKDSLITFIKMAEDTALKGMWKAVDSRGNLIKFLKKDSLFQGVSQKSVYGWNKGDIIYKDVFYEGHGIWDVKPKIWITFLGITLRTYYSKDKGMIKFLHEDTIKIFYERKMHSKNTIKFARQEEKTSS